MFYAYVCNVPISKRSIQLSVCSLPTTKRQFHHLTGHRNSLMEKAKLVVFSPHLVSHHPKREQQTRQSKYEKFFQIILVHTIIFSMKLN